MAGKVAREDRVVVPQFARGDRLLSGAGLDDAVYEAERRVLRNHVHGSERGGLRR
jgi:hypothetical protein